MNVRVEFVGQEVEHVLERRAVDSLSRLIGRVELVPDLQGVAGLRAFQADRVVLVFPQRGQFPPGRRPGGKATGGSSGNGTLDLSTRSIVSRKRSSLLPPQFVEFAQVGGVQAHLVGRPIAATGTARPLLICSCWSTSASL